LAAKLLLSLTVIRQVVLSAGFLALLVAEIVTGNSRQDAIWAAKAALVKSPNHGEVLEAVEKAEWLASSAATTPRPELAKVGLRRKLSR
jgi:hypothetical protein